MSNQPSIIIRNKHLNLKNLDLSSAEFPLEQIDLSKYEGIQKGIPLFENNSLQDILQSNSHLVLFEDANLHDARVKDVNGQIHNVRECIEQVWNKLFFAINQRFTIASFRVTF